MYNLPYIDMSGTGEQIRKLREEAGLSVRELQNIFGFSSPQAIYKWQYGQSLPSVDNLLALSVILNVSIEKILVVENDSGDFNYRFNAICCFPC